VVFEHTSLTESYTPTNALIIIIIIIIIIIGI